MNNMGTRPPKISIKYSKASQESSKQLSSLQHNNQSGIYVTKNRIYAKNSVFLMFLYRDPPKPEGKGTIPIPVSHPK
jgi:hypothetical protein